MTEKKLDEITVKVTHEQKRLFVSLAEVKGLTASDALRMMMERFVEEHRREFESMQSIFGDHE